MQHIYLKNRSYSVENLPSEPSLLIELLELCRNDNANFEMFSAAIKKDVGLTSKILQVANSPAYRQWNKITDIRRMLIVLGLTNVRNIVTTCAIQQFFAHFTREFNRNVQFTWLRSLVCANLCERLATLTAYEKPGEAFLAGLLHQVGVLLLLLNREQDYLPVLEKYYLSDDNLSSIEQESLQIDHCELGAALIDTWALDSFIADAIHFQHAPAEELAGAPVLLKIVAAAAPLSAKNSARRQPLLLERAGALFNLTEDTTLACLDAAIDKSRQMIADLGFSGKFYSAENEHELFDDESHRQQQQKLGETVKNIALSTTIGRSEKAEIVELSKGIRASFKTLFNIGRLCFFRADEERTRLHAVNDLEINQLDEIEFSTDDSRSLLVSVFRDKTPLTTISASCSIIDRQLIRLLESEEMYCLPLVDRQQCLGVLALGTNRQEWPLLERKSDFFQLLGREIARHYRILKREDRQSAGMSMVDFRKVAHEVSNPLTIINNYLYTLGKKIEHDHPAQEEIKYISEEIERAGQILLRAKDPQSPSRTDNRTVDINQLLREMDALFNGSLYKTKGIKSTLALDDGIPPCCCARDKLKQALLNLLKNAVEALGENGIVRIATRDNFYQNNRQYIEITIDDNGPGIPPDILENLFKPVTSTKEGHSGLGLSIVKTLVDELSGSISCYTRLGEGTEFTLLVPRVLKPDEFAIE